jgi:hypothetical protein
MEAWPPFLYGRESHQAGARGDAIRDDDLVARSRARDHLGEPLR